MKRGRHTVRLMPLTKATTSPQGSLLSSPQQQVISRPPSYPLPFDSLDIPLPVYLDVLRSD